MATKAYKRSWKNLLLNKRYQLRFTLFMVGLAAVLMAGLGIWVMKEANEATTVAMARVRGEACPRVPVLNDTGTGEDEGAQVPLKLDEEPSGDKPAGSAAPRPPEQAKPAPAPEPAKKADEHDPMYLATIWCAGAGLACTPQIGKPLVLSGPDCDALVAGMLNKHDYVEALIATKVPSVKCEGGKTYPVPKTAPKAGVGAVEAKTTTDVVEPEHHVKVQIDESSMTLTPAVQAPAVPTNYIDLIVGHWTCELRQSGAIDSLESGRLRILWVLIATGILLMLGLAAYGIKMTHRVAGPLFKVGLYLAKMREGRFDKVYNLRKGDQLVDFYEHFKAAHAGVVQLERGDIEQIKAVIAAAEAAGAGDHASIAELRTALQRKEKSLE